jgi:hypothetical protein
MNPIIQCRERRTGLTLLQMPLYDFLKALHTATPAADEFRFEDIQIVIDGEELLPTAGGNA